MVYRYCEFCNKNINIKEGQILCKYCGRLLNERPETPQEKEDRDEERTTYCEVCDKKAYAVPLEIARSKIEAEVQLKLNYLKKPTKPVLKVKDGRYKPGYRLTEEGEKRKWKMHLLFLFTIITLGLALIPISIYYYIKHRNKAKKIKEGSDIITMSLEKIRHRLTTIGKDYNYICSLCYNGIKLGNKRDYSIKRVHLSFDYRCYELRDASVLSEEMGGFIKFFKNHLLIAILGISLIILAVISGSIGQESALNNILTPIIGVVTLSLIIAIIVDFVRSRKQKGDKSKEEEAKITEQIKIQQEEMRSQLDHLSNEVNALIINGNKDYNEGRLEAAVNFWERALDMLKNAKTHIKGLNMYAEEYIAEAQRKLRINIRNANKSIKEEIRVQSHLEAPKEIYCPA